jgi:hypothetical protein
LRQVPSPSKSSRSRRPARRAALWLIYGALVFATYALVRSLRWLLLAGVIAVVFLIIRQKM